MSAPAPKSREEWSIELDNLGSEYKHNYFTFYKDLRKSVLDSIMDLQSEVERVKAELSGALSVISSARKDLEWPDSGTHHEAAYHTLNNFEKARQPK